MIPIRTDSPLRTTPWMNWLLILLNVAIYLLEIAKPQIRQMYVLQPRDPKLYQFVTYAFLHASTMHLISNMLFLFIFGNNVNDKIGNIGYLAFYLGGAVTAAVGYILAENRPMLGASGAVAAVTGAYLALLPRTNITVVWLFFIYGVSEIPSFYFILIFFAQDLFLNFAGNTGVAHLAHISGTIYGFVVCAILLAVRLLPRDQFDIVALMHRWNKRRQYRGMVSKGFDPFGLQQASQIPDRGPADPKSQQILELRARISDATRQHDNAAAAEMYQQLRQIDPQQVLSRQAQLDIANQLASQQNFKAAAEAYELFLKAYPNFEQLEQVELMLGLIYARYLNQYSRAKQCLIHAVARLHSEREIDLAKSELLRIEPLIGGAM